MHEWVCVSVHERESVLLCVIGREREGVCLCVPVCEKEGEFLGLCVRKNERGCEIVRAPGIVLEKWVEVYFYKKRYKRKTVGF